MQSKEKIQRERKENGRKRTKKEDAEKVDKNAKVALQRVHSVVDW